MDNGKKKLAHLPTAVLEDMWRERHPVPLLDHVGRVVPPEGPLLDHFGRVPDDLEGAEEEALDEELVELLTRRKEEDLLGAR